MKKIIIFFTVYTIAICQVVVSCAQGITNEKYIGGNWIDFSVDAPSKEVFNRNVFPNQPNVMFNYIPSSKKIAFSTYFLKTDTLSLYRYTIILDHAPIKLNQSFEGLNVYEDKFNPQFNNVNLGTYNITNKSLTILLYKTSQPEKIFKSIYFAKIIQPAKISSITKGVVFDDEGSGIAADPDNVKDILLSNKTRALNIVIDKTDIDFLYRLMIADPISGKIIFTSTSWNYDNSHYNVVADDYLPYVSIDKGVFKKSGDYEVIIQPLIEGGTSKAAIEKYVTRHTISITLDEENFTKKELFTYIGYSGALLGIIFGLIGVYIKRKNKKKLLAEQQQKEISKSKLEVVRSQLNPHFLFNALAGIQNLMNKSEIDNANRYLSKFARLTRNVLDSKELVSLTEEKTLLDDYLQMEQLRFGFKYELNASADLDTENIEIPAMLLQPFVENAIKHGIAEKGNKGEITICFEKQTSDLVLKISDNGKGFNATQKYNGLGLALSKNRISLLNTIYKNTPFVLDIQSDINGTVVTITLTQWL